MTRPRGRPTAPVTRAPDRLAPRTVYLDDLTVDAARKIGNGSISAGLRIAVAHMITVVE